MKKLQQPLICPICNCELSVELIVDSLFGDYLMYCTNPMCIWHEKSKVSPILLKDTQSESTRRYWSKQVWLPR